MTPELDMNKHTSAGSTVFKASRVAHDTDDLYQINARHCLNCVLFIVCSNQLVISHHTDKYFRSTSSHRQGWLTTARQVSNIAHLTPPLADLDYYLTRMLIIPCLTTDENEHLSYHLGLKQERCLLQAGQRGAQNATEASMTFGCRSRKRGWPACSKCRVCHVGPARAQVRPPTSLRNILFNAYWNFKSDRRLSLQKWCT